MPHDLSPEAVGALEKYLEGLTPAQRIRWRYLAAVEPEVVRTDLPCGDCGTILELRLGRYGRFYGCPRFKETGCQGSLSAREDGTPKGWPGDAATRKARKRLVERFQATPFWEHKLSEDIGPPRLSPFHTADRRTATSSRWATICELLKTDPQTGFSVGDLTQEQCASVEAVLDILDMPAMTRWDHLRLDDLMDDA